MAVSATGRRLAMDIVRVEEQQGLPPSGKERQRHQEQSENEDNYIDGALHVIVPFSQIFNLKIPSNRLLHAGDHREGLFQGLTL